MLFIWSVSKFDSRPKAAFWLRFEGGLPITHVIFAFRCKALQREALEKVIFTDFGLVGSLSDAAPYSVTVLWGGWLKMRKLACVIALLIALPSLARANVTEENFALDTTGDLIALCGVDAADPNAMAAIHMCHGYFVGLHHFHMMMGRALEGHIYCMTDQNRPTRDQVIAMLVEWSRAHPEHDSMEAIDGVLQWAADTYPCE